MLGFLLWIAYCVIFVSCDVTLNKTKYVPQATQQLIGSAPSHISRSLKLNGDVILGALLTMHVQIASYHPSNLPDAHELMNVCNGQFVGNAFQMSVALVEAIKRVNRNTFLLPDVKLGLNLQDTCGSVDRAIQGTLKFSFVTKHLFNPAHCTKFMKRTRAGHLNQEAEESRSESHKPDPEVVAILGPDMSDSARAISDLAGLFHVPVVSSSATSTTLSNAKRFPYFLRTIQSDEHQVRFIREILKGYGWTNVILLASDDEYGRAGRNALRGAISHVHSRTCAEVDELFNANNIGKVAQKLKDAQKQTSIRVIILFSSLSYVNLILDKARELQMYGYLWIASDAWAGHQTVTEKYSDILEGMLGVTPKSAPVPWFKEHLLKLARNNTSSNPWLSEFRMHDMIDCEYGNYQICKLGKYYKISSFVGSTFDSVFAVASGIHSLLNCTVEKCNTRPENARWDNLIDHIKSSDFRSVDGHVRKFGDKSSAGIKSYDLINYQWIPSLGKHKFVKVAEREQTAQRRIVIRFTGKMVWPMKMGLPPRSSCSMNCGKGYHRITIAKSNARCCWDCSQCSGNSYSNQTNVRSCTPCPEDTYVSDDHSTCKPVKYTYVQWSDPWCRVISALSLLGLLLIMVTLLVFIKYRDTPVVKASSRGLCYFLLVGVSLYYILPMTTFVKPTDITCAIMPFTMGICLSLNVGTLLVKTNRISRIFSRKLFQNKQARFLDNRYQYMLVFFLVLMELFCCLLWVIVLEPPRLRHEMLSNGKEKICGCDFKAGVSGLAIWAVYNAGLILLCTYQAFAVRKVPSNYNEAKFIAFSMITTCTTVVIYIPLHFSTVSYEREILVSFLYVFLGAVQFTSMFVPKLYIILFRPEKNVAMNLGSHKPSFLNKIENDLKGFDTEEWIDDYNNALKSKVRKRWKRKQKKSIILDDEVFETDSRDQNFPSISNDIKEDTKFEFVQSNYKTTKKSSRRKATASNNENNFCIVNLSFQMLQKTGNNSEELEGNIGEDERQISPANTTQQNLDDPLKAGESHSPNFLSIKKEHSFNKKVSWDDSHINEGFEDSCLTAGVLKKSVFSKARGYTFDTAELKPVKGVPCQNSAKRRRKMTPS